MQKDGARDRTPCCHSHHSLRSSSALRALRSFSTAFSNPNSLLPHRDELKSASVFCKKILPTSASSNLGTPLQEALAHPGEKENLSPHVPGCGELMPYNSNLGCVRFKIAGIRKRQEDPRNHQKFAGFQQLKSPQTLAATPLH